MLPGLASKLLHGDLLLCQVALARDHERGENGLPMIRSISHHWPQHQHGRHHGWAMDALFSERVTPWKSSWFGHGCSLLRAHSTMDVIMAGPWMLSPQNGLSHGRHHGSAVPSERFPPWTRRYHGWAMDALFSGCSLLRTHETIDVIMVGGLTTSNFVGEAIKSNIGETKPIFRTLRKPSIPA